MAEGSDDPEGEESSEWFLPPSQLYLLSDNLNMPELENASPEFCHLTYFVCMLTRLFFTKGEGKRNVRHGRTRRAGKKCPGWKLRAHSHRHGPRRRRAALGCRWKTLHRSLRRIRWSNSRPLPSRTRRSRDATSEK